MKKVVFTLAWLAAFMLLAGAVHAQKVVQMTGGVLIDGYDFGKDIGPKGTIVYNKKKNEFKGTYAGLKMPPGRRAIFAWVHDTVNQKTRYIGAVGWMQKTGGKKKGRFTIKVPNEFKGGKFGSYEIIAFTSEKTNFLKGNKVVTRPKSPSGSDIQKTLRPAFYMFAALPGADTKQHYCGHGQDFFYAKAPGKQTCYD
jgi:hypothetical protein